MLVEDLNVKKFATAVGGKAYNLHLLKQNGIKVPSFFAIPATNTTELYHRLRNNQALPEIDQIFKKFSTVAIRSSALIEDSMDSSFAGQFLSELNVKKSNFRQSTLRVLEHAQDKLNGDLSKFCLIVQEFINPEIVGVCFTRDPQFSQHMVIEFLQSGRADVIVSGESKPRQVYITQNQQKFAYPLNKDLIDLFYKIEDLFGHAQDIEWNFDGRDFNILQSRPITTVSKLEYESLKILDGLTAKLKIPFTYQKNELSESVPRLTPLMTSLLQQIYSKGGPVSRAYNKYRISFVQRDFIKDIKSHLFVDLFKEAQTLLPISGFNFKTNKPRFSVVNSLKSPIGFIKTINNILRLSFLNTGKRKVVEVAESLKNSIEKFTDKQEQSFESILLDFLKDYQKVFEVSLLSGKVNQTVSLLLQKEKLDPLEFLRPEFSFKIPHIVFEDTAHLLGNGLNILDETKFEFSIPRQTETEAFNFLPSQINKYKRTVLENLVKSNNTFSTLREYSRLLTVLHINKIRNAAIEIARKKNYKDLRLIYFADLNSILNNKLTEEELNVPKSEFNKNSLLSFPSTISIYPRQKNDKDLLAVSAGSCTGYVVSTVQLDSQDFEGKVILKTENLDSTYTKYFGKIAGILSVNGGYLSHLAIMCRENNIPVLVGNEVKKVTMGSLVQLNANTAEILTEGEDVLSYTQRVSVSKHSRLQ
jgi:phosphohistidine swiveling domain-containing protein